MQPHFLQANVCGLVVDVLSEMTDGATEMEGRTPELPGPVLISSAAALSGELDKALLAEKASQWQPLPSLSTLIRQTLQSRRTVRLRWKEVDSFDELPRLSHEASTEGLPVQKWYMSLHHLIIAYCRRSTPCPLWGEGRQIFGGLEAGGSRPCLGTRVGSGCKTIML